MVDEHGKVDKQIDHLLAQGAPQVEVDADSVIDFITDLFCQLVERPALAEFAEQMPA
ncbi:MAG: hypothetical protein ACD_75C00314G0003 [uncultured bacterium]|nr:MAG: hypothetical protein ACD_75C00314G0003 [uncultured bacterium]